MIVPDYPRLRPYLAVTKLETSHSLGKEYLLYDRLRLAPTHLLLTALELECLKQMDGKHSLADIYDIATRLLYNMIIPRDVITGLVDRLARSFYLDTPAFREIVASPVRKPACLGCMDPDPQAFREQMEALFLQPGAAGLPGEPSSQSALRVLLAPHIDYTRGGVAYSFAYKELVEQTRASLFVIIGTSHYCSWRRFILSRKHYQTPLGIVPTDQTYIDRLVAEVGEEWFDEEWIAHLPEHSIELEVTLLHYLYEKQRPIRIVPVLVGSFDDLLPTDRGPESDAGVRRMIQALRSIEAKYDEPICYIISGDLAHIGPRFGASHPLRATELLASRQQDMSLVLQMEKVSPRGYFQVIKQEQDQRNICGFPPTWVTLSAIRPGRGRLLKYGQFVDVDGNESVSYASVGCYEE